MTATNGNELNAHDPEWQRYAVRLAAMRVMFEVAGLNSLDYSFCQVVRDRFDFDTTHDYKAGRVHYIPRDLSSGINGRL